MNFFQAFLWKLFTRLDAKIIGLSLTFYVFFFFPLPAFGGQSCTFFGRWLSFVVNESSGWKVEGIPE